MLDIPGVGGPHLEDQDLGALVGREHREGKTDLVVEVPGGRRDPLASVPEHGGQGVLGRGLAYRPRDTDDQRSEVIVPHQRPSGEALHRFQRVSHDEGRHLEGTGCHRRDGATQVSLGRELGTVRSPAQGEEEVAFAHHPRVRRRTAHERPFVPGGEPGVENARHLSQGGGPHGLSPCAAALAEPLSGGTLK
jgi:hypothetical protein